MFKQLNEALKLNPDWRLVGFKEFEPPVKFKILPKFKTVTEMIFRLPNGNHKIMLIRGSIQDMAKATVTTEHDPGYLARETPLPDKDGDTTPGQTVLVTDSIPNPFFHVDYPSKGTKYEGDSFVDDPIPDETEARARVSAEFQKVWEMVEFGDDIFDTIRGTRKAMDPAKA